VNIRAFPAALEDRHGSRNAPGFELVPFRRPDQACMVGRSAVRFAARDLGSS
jgi:hypothetical protein